MPDKFKLPFNKRTLTSYELILTENCNFRCKYCFDDSFSDRTKCSYNYVMPLERIPDVISFIEKTRQKTAIPSITFFGGEPTLNWGFIENFISYAKAHNYRYSYSMNTNCSLLTPEKVNFLVDNRINTIISLDGIQKSHDKSRVFQNGKSTWGTIMKNLPNVIGRLRANRVPVTAMMVINRDTFQQLEENYLFLRSLGFLEVNILWCWEEVFSQSELLFILKSLKDLFIEKRAPLWLDAKRNLLSKRYNFENDTYCHLPTTGVTINCRGQLYFCHRLVPKMSDALTEETLGDIYSGFTNTQYLSFLNKRLTHKDRKVNATCSHCDCRSFCKSGCIGSIRNNSSDYLIIEPLCNIQKILLEFKKSYENTFGAGRIL